MPHVCIKMVAAKAPHLELLALLAACLATAEPARPPPSYQSRITQWLQTSSTGYCNGTDYDDISADTSCKYGDRGGWGMLPAQTKTWIDALTVCQQRCEVCRGCNFLSLSLDMRDCSWFRSCDISALHTVSPSVAIASSFRSAPSGKPLRTPLARPRNPQHTGRTLHRHNLVCRTLGGGFGVPSGPLRISFSPLEKGDIYQFGVAQGYSLSQLLKIHDGRRAWAFDTFSGMPDPEKGEPTFHVTWRRGAFNSMASARRAARLPLLGNLISKVHTVVGRFQESLTPGLAAQLGMSPAVYVDIDADLYSSAMVALDWMFQEDLIKVGTVIGYDDYWDLACKNGSSKVERYGEAKAHVEISIKHKVQFQCVCGPCGPLPSRGDAPVSLRPWGWRTYFVVLGFGTADAGITMPHADAAEFVNFHPTCRGLWDRNSTHWLGVV